MRAPEREKEFHCQSCGGGFNSDHELRQHQCPCETADHIALQLRMDGRGKVQVVERPLAPFATLLSLLRYSQESRRTDTIL